jgi:transposase-like protein
VFTEAIDLETVSNGLDAKNCNDFMVAMRWPDGQVLCPRCGSENVTYLETARVWKCYSKHPKAKFSLKVGTIFEDSPLGLDKWFTAMWLIANCKNGISSYELGRHLGITQKAAWHVNHRIRLAMQNGSLNKLSGHVEVDETFIGGKARNMHRATLAKRVAQFSTPRTGRNQNIGKVAVMGVLERNGEVRTAVLSNVKRRSLHGEVNRHVEAGSTVYSDALRSYNQLDEEYVHHGDQSRGRIRAWSCSHERDRKLLESAKADTQGYICIGRTLPPVSLS